MNYISPIVIEQVHEHVGRSRLDEKIAEESGSYAIALLIRLLNMITSTNYHHVSLRNSSRFIRSC